MTRSHHLRRKRRSAYRIFRQRQRRWAEWADDIRSFYLMTTTEGERESRGASRKAKRG